MRMIASLILILATSLTQAQEWRTEPLSPVDQRYISSQRDALDDLARTHLGRQFNGEKSNDLSVLQALLDQQLVRSDQSELLQAMGFILGDLLKEELGLLWVAYTDKLGRSRALEIPGTREFLFPVTMISRRAETGIQVNVMEIYQRAVGIATDIKNAPRF